MKTIKQWLETLEEPYRSQALENCEKRYIGMLSVSVVTALETAFIWSKSPQGREYWSKVCIKHYFDGYEKNT